MTCNVDDEKSPLVGADPYDKNSSPYLVSIDRGQGRCIDVDCAVADEFSHLPPHEAKILREQVAIKPARVNFLSFYRYATTKDILLLLIATVCAIADGCMRPLMTFVFGSITQTFTAYAAQHNIGYYNRTNVELYDRYNNLAHKQVNGSYLPYDQTGIYELDFRYISQMNSRQR
ncbi:hypothetical protein V1525DRAFT_231800 [Lipomyces kononenkoae]|uniref:Uncharacterized protein n=1 Tax=Lipomyces kononenkoae TaxID=34357 RepID=A0ACC3SWR2_LIPKO